MRFKEFLMTEEFENPVVFGPFSVLLPTSDDEAKEFSYSLGAAGLAPFKESIVGETDPHLFTEAAKDLEMQLSSIESFLLTSIMDEKLGQMFYGDILETFNWLKGSYDKDDIGYVDGKWEYDPSSVYDPEEHQRSIIN